MPSGSSVVPSPVTVTWMQPTYSCGPDDDLVANLGFHSLALLELAFTLEDEYDLQPIDEQTARGIRTVRDVEDTVVRMLAERG